MMLGHLSYATTLFNWYSATVGGIIGAVLQPRASWDCHPEVNYKEGTSGAYLIGRTLRRNNATGVWQEADEGTGLARVRCGTCQHRGFRAWRECTYYSEDGMSMSVAMGPLPPS
jgi:hypothetical protein